MVDESGDFGVPTADSPYYLLTLVFHNQSNSISEHCQQLEQTMADSGFEPHAIHTGPLIRREGSYYNYSKEDRKSIFKKLFYFSRKVDASYKTFSFSKREDGHGPQLSIRMSQSLKSFLGENLAYFQSFDRIVIYYDNGQHQITNLLASVFGTTISGGLEFTQAAPSDYKLLQLADMACTLELIDLKRRAKIISKSERLFFGIDKREFVNLLKALRKKKFERNST
jgi:hypothetical protein